MAAARASHGPRSLPMPRFPLAEAAAGNGKEKTTPVRPSVRSDSPGIDPSILRHGQLRARLQ
ncbi:hypothetical protein E2562_016867 [Oryza meyeriana var. granulata]|uniref:Uncharacterized protein n=1 Tax=Oryza meyeriana var. granulata TaxID=110450 RepID=A0A6G1BXS5_9ORYZ|nr:hypothetical protein E2562_016867 [Oryza meyeriana var. granulata]